MFCNYSDPQKSMLERITPRVCEPDLSGFILVALKFTYNLYNVYTTSIQPWRTGFYGTLNSDPLKWGRMKSSFYIQHCNWLIHYRQNALQMEVFNIYSPTW